MSITGDLNQITHFYALYDMGMIDRINFDNLPSLTELVFGWTRGPKVVDLSHNTKLESILIVALRSMEVLKLRADKEITSLILKEQPALPSTAIDEIIHSIYRSVVRHRKSGYIELDVPLDELSFQSVHELTQLKVAFGWEIVPDPVE